MLRERAILVRYKLKLTAWVSTCWLFGSGDESFVGDSAREVVVFGGFGVPGLVIGGLWLNL